MTGKRHGSIKNLMGFLLTLILTAIMGSAAFAERDYESSFQLNVAIEDVRVTLSWDAVENAESYNLLYLPKPNPFNQKISSHPVGNQTTVSFNLDDGASYYAAMEAVNGSEVVGYSNVESVVVQLEPLVSASLTAFESDEALAKYLKKGLIENAGQYSSWYNEDSVVFTPVSDAGTAEDSTVTFSTTNLQETGVDEADIIKTDGRYLYIAPSEYGGVYPEPALPEIGKSRAVPEDSSAEIDVFEITDTPPASAILGAISLKNHENPVEGLYLLTDRGNDKPDLLVTVGGQARNYWDSWCNPWFWTSGNTEVGLYNVNDPLNAEAVTLITIDGQLISSRRIRDVLYVVTRYTPGLEEFNPYPVDQREEEANDAALEKADLSDLLPTYSLNGQSQGSMVQAQGCFLPPYEEDVVPEPSLITVTAITLSDPGNPVSQTITGPTETIYVSTDTLYLATTRYEYTAPTTDPDQVGASALIVADIWTPPPETTDLHKFNLTENGPVYRGSGAVPGNLGWEEDKKPFRMSHYNGVMRIATSLGDTWSGTSTTRLTLLRENPDAAGDVLEEISRIEGIGEAGEKLYAVRFLGARAYLVTFRVTDPLYVFDLSDPENPLKKGELHIDGYSDYLHPIGETLLLGIGKDAVPDESSNDFGGRGAWYQGVKLSLFDVTDPSTPREVDSLVYGKRGSDSDALVDHHALAYLPPMNGSPARLALPMQLHETVPTDFWFDSSEPSAYYDWTHTGLYMFDINTGESGGRAGIDKRGHIIAESIGNQDNAYWGWARDRSVLLNHSVHYIHNDKVLSAEWGSAQ